MGSDCDLPTAAQRFALPAVRREPAFKMEPELRADKAALTGA